MQEDNRLLAQEGDLLHARETIFQKRILFLYRKTALSLLKNIIFFLYKTQVFTWSSTICRYSPPFVVTCHCSPLFATILAEVWFVVLLNICCSVWAVGFCMTRESNTGKGLATMSASCCAVGCHALIERSTCAAAHGKQENIHARSRCGLTLCLLFRAGGQRIPLILQMLFAPLVFHGAV